MSSQRSSAARAIVAMRRLVGPIVCSCAVPAFAQQPEPEPDTRQTIIVNAADEKAKSLHPYEVTVAEKPLDRVGCAREL